MAQKSRGEKVTEEPRGYTLNLQLEEYPGTPLVVTRGGSTCSANPMSTEARGQDLWSTTSSPSSFNDQPGIVPGFRTYYYDCSRAVNTCKVIPISLFLGEKVSKLGPGIFAAPPTGGSSTLEHASPGEGS